MGVPWEMTPLANIVLTDVPRIVAVDWPHRSVISKIVAVQTSGLEEAFTLALYNHPIGAGESESDSEGAEVGAIPTDCYRVSPNLVANAEGKLIYFSDQATGGYGFVFFSQKATTGRQGQRDSKLYVKLTPTGTGTKHIALCIGGQKEVE